MSLTATAKAQAVDELDEIAQALKRSHDANKLALQKVRQLQARIVGIDVRAPVAQIREAHAALSSITRPETGGRSVSNSSAQEADPGGTRARVAGG